MTAPGVPGGMRRHSERDFGQTNQITSRSLASSTLATTWSYLTNTNDRRLAEISNVGLSSGQHSTYDYTTTPENFITGITETSDTATVYPTATTQTATHNNLNQITDLSGQSLTWDADGNLLSDGARTYTWDAENRLVGIGYPGVSGKAAAFTYDGLSRRVAIASTPSGGGSSVATSYLWCGSAICQARNASNATTREYLAEGEVVPGTTPTTDYYGIDQIGSVRRVFASTSSAPAFSYDPYGVPLQATTSLADFTYAGMFSNADSGLDLTQYRAIRARIDVVAETLGLEDREIEDTMSDEGLIDFARRQRQSLDWILRGDVRAYLPAGAHAPR